MNKPARCPPCSDADDSANDEQRAVHMDGSCDHRLSNSNETGNQIIAVTNHRSGQWLRSAAE